MRVLYPPYISWEKKNQNKVNFCINNDLLFQFYIQEFEYLSKIFILPKPTTVYKWKEAESKLWADRCNRKRVERIFSCAKEAWQT